MTAINDNSDEAVTGWAELGSLVHWMDAHLDADVADTYKDNILAQHWGRVAKVAEEAGEAIDALIGITGQNPRKGHYGCMNDLVAELADVALTGLYAIQHFTKDSEHTLEELLWRARYHRERVEGLGNGHAETPPKPDQNGSDRA